MILLGIFKFFIIMTYYILGAYATTDIIRLASGAGHEVLSSDSFCSSCGHVIRLRDQIPIFAFLVNKGKCHYCKCKIPAENFILEIIVFLPLSIISLCLNFTYTAFGISVLYYEIVKLVYLIIKGKRKDSFTGNLTKSFLMNAIIFLLIFSIYFMKYILVAHIS